MSKKLFQIISDDPLVIQGRIALPYKYYVGPVATRFFTELRDNKKMLGMRCTQCGITYVPPRETCGRCFSKLEKWTEVGSKGTLLTYTATYYPLEVHPYKEPIIYGVIRVNGADTGFVHILGEVNPSEVKIGMGLEAVFKEERTGNILDIKYFRPAKD